MNSFFSGCPTCWTETASAQGSFTFGPSFPPKDSLVPRKLPEPDILEELVHIIFEFLSFFLADILPAGWGRRKKLGLRHALATYVVGVCPSLTETLLSLPGQVKLSTGAHCWCWVRAWYVVVSKRAHILLIKSTVLPGHKMINAWAKECQALSQKWWRGHHFLLDPLDTLQWSLSFSVGQFSSWSTGVHRLRRTEQVSVGSKPDTRGLL